jgi:hypothetical protein
VVAPPSAAAAHRFDQTQRLVEAQRRCVDAAALREVADAHQRIILNFHDVFPLDFKLT